MSKSLSDETAQTSFKSQQHKNDVVNIIEVHSVGNLSDRITAFNDFLISLRKEKLSERRGSPWQAPALSRLDVLLGKRDNSYLQLLSNYSNITTVVVPRLTSGDAWRSLQDTSNLVMQTGGWTADKKGCSWLIASKKYRATKCSSNISDSVRRSSFYREYIVGNRINRTRHWANTSYTNTLFYIHIHRDAIVTQFGDVVSGNLKLVLPSCFKDTRKSVRGHVEHFPLYGELFVITQFWGYGYFHFMAEVMPRLVLYADFLKSNPEIRILAPKVIGRLSQFLKIIGLEKSRPVTGITRAKIVYQPRTTPCGSANIPESQMLSQRYIDYITRTFPPQPRNKLILIRRSGHRKFRRHDEIEEVLKHAANEYNMTYELFIDNPLPSLKDTMMMFHSAVIIVAPHGAGLANMLFSQPGTYVVEGFCNNLCFRRLAYVLGHHWHGIKARNGVCRKYVDVTASSVDFAVRSYLHLWNTTL